MSATRLLLSPTPPASAESRGGQPKTCRFAANCSCVFNRVAPDAAGSVAAQAAEVAVAEVTVGGVAVAGIAAAEVAGAVETQQAPDAATAAPRNEALEAEVALLLSQGFRIASADPGQIVLQRRRSIPFCVNVALLAATVGIWGAHMAWRARRPRVETVTLTLNRESVAA